jgi:hypothetical protein
LTLFPLFFIKSIGYLSWEEETGDMRSLHGKVEGDEINGRAGNWVTMLPELPCLKIFSDNLGNFQIMFVGCQDL